VVFGAVIVVALLLVGYRYGGTGISDSSQGGSISVSDAEVCLRAGGTIYFNVTYGTETYLKKVGLWEQAEQKLRYSQPFVFNAGTHVGTIRDLNLDGKIFLEYGGIRYPTVGQAVASSTHHDTWLVFLPKFDMDGGAIFENKTGSFTIWIEGVDIPEIRELTFKLPLPIAGGQGVGTRQMLMIVGATMAAMLLICTPCLVGSLTVGSLAMGSVWGDEEELNAQQIRKKLIKQTAYYLLALVIGYIAVSIAASAFDVSLEDIRPIEVMGGVLLSILGIGFLRTWKPIIWLENFFVAVILKVSPGFRKYVTDEKPEAGLMSMSSSAMGASLAMVCSVAGAPTLTTAIILPVVIFVGLNDLYWSLLILLVYLLITALPFFLISVGLGEYLLNLSLAWRHKLLVANGFVLLALGIMLIFSPEGVAGVLSAPARLILEPLTLFYK
jgi:hypothetical protein